MNKKRLKRYRPVGVMVILELIFYNWIKPADPQFFFLPIILFSACILLYNIFNIRGDNRLDGVGGGIGSERIGMVGTQIEKTFETKASKKRSGGGLFDPSNLSLLLFVVVNMFLYRWMM